MNPGQIFSFLTTKGFPIDGMSLRENPIWGYTFIVNPNGLHVRSGEFIPTFHVFTLCNFQGA